MARKGLRRLLKKFADTNEQLDGETFSDIKCFFPENDKWKDLHMTPEAAWSIMTPNMNNQLHYHIEQLLGYKIQDLVITDATSCSGGSAIGFARKARHTNMIEINPIHYNMLLHNLKLYDLKSYNTYNTDYSKIYDQLVQDVIFVDPPWGGLDYLNKPNEIFIGDESLWNFVGKITKYARLTVVRVPINYPVADFNNLEIILKYKKYKYVALL